MPSSGKSAISPFGTSGVGMIEITSSFSVINIELVETPAVTPAFGQCLPPTGKTLALI
jgi:hypothetical protein